ncbi:MAG: hypothetical protein GY817_01300 [bacterium]|nr:hypothetical protein [bacterium]
MSKEELLSASSESEIIRGLKENRGLSLKDNNGNFEIINGRRIFYDYENRPIKIINQDGRKIEYMYDFEGNRVKTIENNVTTVYIGTIYEEKPGENICYIYGGNQRLALKSSVDGVMYFHGDHLGSTNVITDENGNEVRKTTYQPYGATFETSGSKNNARQYTGQVYDGNVGLYYYNARYYDSELKRFITPDTIVPNPYDPQSLNRYSYCQNNPIIYADPSGHFLTAIIVGAVIGALTAGTDGFTKDLDEFDWQAAGEGALVGAAIGAGGFALAGTPGVVGGMGGMISGGMSASRNGGDLITGMSVGGALGVLGAKGASFVSFGSGGFWSTVGQEAVKGSIYGASHGAAYGYAGGAGSTQNILDGMGQGALLGAAVGAVVGAGSYQFQGGKEYSFINKGKMQDVLKPATGIESSSYHTQMSLLENTSSAVGKDAAFSLVMDTAKDIAFQEGSGGVFSITVSQEMILNASPYIYSAAGVYAPEYFSGNWGISLPSYKKKF